jgi:hypothetical protein
MQRGSHSTLTGRSAARVVGLRASQRMLAQAVLGQCARLLRLAQAQGFATITAEMNELMGSRRALLRQLQTGIRSAAELSCIAAVSGAVAEADRGLLVMMDPAATLQH